MTVNRSSREPTSPRWGNDLAVAVVLIYLGTFPVPFAPAEFYHQREKYQLKFKSEAEAVPRGSLVYRSPGHCRICVCGATV